MIKTKTFHVNPLEVNCYVVSDETNEGVIIDPGCFAKAEWDEISHYIYNKGISIKHLLLTHAHFDHIMGCHYGYENFGLQPICHTNDISVYKSLPVQTQMFLGPGIKTPEQPSIGRALNGDEEISFGNHTIKVLHTPGHSPGCVCYLIQDENVIFTGDTLFAGSMGRTDLEGGNNLQMAKSLIKLASLTANLHVYPGHGPETTIATEQQWIRKYFKE